MIFNIKFKSLFVLGLFLLEISFAYSQKLKNQGSSKLVKTSEKIENYNFDRSFYKNRSLLMPIGFFNNKIVYLYKVKQNSVGEFLILNEENNSFASIYDGVKIDDKSFDFSAKDSLLFYAEKKFTSMEDVGYNSLILYHSGKEFILDSVYNADKKIHSSFSSDGKYLIVNTLNTLADYYDSRSDDKFVIFSLDSLYNSVISRNDLSCKYCSNGYLINNTLFFTKSNIRDDLTGGYSWTDIYKCDKGNIKDSILLARFSKIRAISPDGRYVLAERPFDLPNRPLAIIDSKYKKYQLLLGRDYSNAFAFYSVKKSMFAFDFGGKIVYVDLPKEFPFDALQKGNKEIPSYSDKAFYEKYAHPPFID